MCVQNIILKIQKIWGRYPELTHTYYSNSWSGEEIIRVQTLNTIRVKRLIVSQKFQIPLKLKLCAISEVHCKPLSLEINTDSQCQVHFLGASWELNIIH